MLIISILLSLYTKYQFNSKNFPLIWKRRDSATDHNIIGYYHASIELKKDFLKILYKLHLRQSLINAYYEHIIF